MAAESREVEFDEWYEVPEGDLEQGDLLFNFPIVVAKQLPEGLTPTLARRSINAVVLTQSCDIPKAAQESILLAEVYDYGTLVDKLGGYFKSKEFKRAASAGTTISEVLLPPSPGAMDWSIVYLRHLSVVEKSLFTESVIQEKRLLRIRSPYREHLAQAFARFMMRVGLPQTLHAFQN